MNYLTGCDEATDKPVKLWLCPACKLDKFAKCWRTWVDHSTGQRWACRRHAS